MLQEARKYGDWIIVVVTADEVVKRQKKHEPYQPEAERCAVVRENGADEVVVGDQQPEKYQLLRELEYDVLALGYDQPVSLKEAKSLLMECDHSMVQVVRLTAFEPEKYKSSLIRGLS